MTVPTKRLAALLLLALVASGSLRAQDHASLAGSWELNPEKSASSSKAPSGGFDRERGRGGYPGGGGGLPGRRPGGVVMPNEDEFPLPKGDAGIRELLRAKQQLDISVGDSGITVRDDAGWARRLEPEAGKVRDEDSQGGAAEVETQWKGDKLVTERRLDRGAVIKETFSLDKKANELVVEVEMRIERMPKPVQYRRVYDRMQP